jgi:magnesium-transporting ATPase (P-type)
MSDENKKQKLDDNLIFSSPFESQTKTSTIVYRCDEKEIRVCMKGSPEMMRGNIVQMISKVNSSGKEELSNQNKDDILSSLDDIVKDYAAKKYRIVIVALKTYPIGEFAREICKLKGDTDF